MATPQIPGGQCPHCGAPVIDLFEWTEEYQTPAGKRGILAGDVVFDCSFCEGPLQLVLPLALVAPVKPASTYRVASAVGLAAKRGSGLSIPAYPCRKSWR